jgi:hypothetical protein
LHSNYQNHVTSSAFFVVKFFHFSTKKLGNFWNLFFLTNKFYKFFSFFFNFTKKNYWKMSKEKKNTGYKISSFLMIFIVARAITQWPHCLLLYWLMGFEVHTWKERRGGGQNLKHKTYTTHSIIYTYKGLNYSKRVIDCNIKAGIYCDVH